MTRIYTRAGDGGQTGLLGPGRVSKADVRIRALGALDELNAGLGLLLSTPELPEEIRLPVLRIQNLLFEAGASLASAEPAASAELLGAETQWLEAEIDRMEKELEPLKRFILPGGGLAGASLHWIRTLARRAESLAVEAVTGEAGRGPLLAWLNRLSDALFVLARLANRREGVAETLWESRRSPSQPSKPLDRKE